MKIFYLITRAESGGGQVHVLDLIRGLRHRCEIILGVGEEGFLVDAARQEGVRVHVLRNLVQPTRPLTDLRGIFELSALLRKEKPDLVHAHTSKAGVLGRIAASLTGTSSVFTAHSWAFSDRISWKLKAVGLPLEFLGSRLCARIINVSEANRELARHYRVAPESKMTTVHNGIPDNPRRAEPGALDLCRIVMVARFAAQKDQISLVRALGRVAQPYLLQFVGDGPTRPAVETEVARLGIADRVQFLGERTDVPEVLAGAHVFALATHYEGFPISILEGMRAGLPVVSTDVGGVREAIVDGRSGYLVPHGDLSCLENRLRQLIDDAVLRRTFGIAARIRFEQRFLDTAMLQKTWEVYRSVLSAPGFGANLASALHSGRPQK